jgi:D-ribose pyranose/furanose isomerase RbsD
MANRYDDSIKLILDRLDALAKDNAEIRRENRELKAAISTLKGTKTPTIKQIASVVPKKASSIGNRHAKNPKTLKEAVKVVEASIKKTRGVKAGTVRGPYKKTLAKYAKNLKKTKNYRNASEMQRRQMTRSMKANVKSGRTQSPTFISQKEFEDKVKFYVSESGIETGYMFSRSGNKYAIGRNKKLFYID